MIRLSLLYCFILALMIVAYKRWFVALCGLLFLTVVMQHPSMPTNLFSIPGANPWNATFAVVVICWLLGRARDPEIPRAPHGLVLLAVCYALMIVLAGIAAIIDFDSIRDPRWQAVGPRAVVVDGIINPLKYTLMAVMFFDGARSRQRVKWAMFSAVGSGMCYAFLVLKSVKLRVFTMGYEDARRLTDKLVGLFANDMAELLAFTIWAALVLVVLIPGRWWRFSWIVATLLAMAPFVALKSRAGLLAFCTIGLVLGAMRWRKILIVLPIVAVITVVAVPSVRDRVLTGVDNAGHGDHDWDAISAGRVTGLWPPVLEQIAEAPVFGHGRYAMLREDCYEKILLTERSVPRHPHNSYLEILLDTGAVGLLLCLALMGWILFESSSLMLCKEDPLLSRIGAVALIAAVAELSAGVAGSSFFPSQSTVPALCVWGLALRWGTLRRQVRPIQRPVQINSDEFSDSFSAAGVGTGVVERV